jgi:hypothetical protein
MKRVAWLGTVVLSIVGAGAACGAHPPGADGAHAGARHGATASGDRAWKNAKTGAVVHGAFLSSRSVDGATLVSIERADGEVVRIALEDLAPEDRAEARRRMDAAARMQAGGVAAPALAGAGAGPAGADAPGAKPEQAGPFEAFGPHVAVRWDERWLYVESDGLPHVPGGALGTFAYTHPVMVGIRAWQQQVPLPQNYRGENAWRIPLRPELAARPVSAREQLFRGAIALAANGVPIFNPIKNDGRTDTFLAGELDEFGGHCGRADDYHYHIAPTHLQKHVGAGAPIAYALDGFAIYGLFDPAAAIGHEKACPLGGREPLDELNGHFGAAPAGAEPGTRGVYHYHASAAYPYLNGGMRGVVTVREDQIEPQPRATPVREWLQPLRGARITGFRATGARAWSLEYTVEGRRGYVNYRLEGGNADGTGASCVFEFVGTDGRTTTQTYTARGEGGGVGGGRERRTRRERPEQPRAVDAGFVLTSPDVVDGRLATACTCDGEGRAPTLRWGEPPAGTRAFAVVMHHVPPDGGVHVYMTVANVPATAREFRSGEAGGGVWGVNTVNGGAGYAPPCSKGPGDKAYTITLYALRGPVRAEGVLTREALLKAMEGSVLGSATLEVTYARQEGGREPGRGREGRGPGREGQNRPNLLDRMTSFKTDVPAHDMDVILARPTERSMTVSVRAGAGGRGTVEWWEAGSTGERSRLVQDLEPGVPTAFELSGLRPGAEYRYRVGLGGGAGGAEPVWGEESRMRTRRGRGAAFTFVVQADSHLDQGVEPAVYERTLANMRADEPDFVVDLGDTFMTDKRGAEFTTALAQYDAQRYYLGLVARSAPLFMVLGNHDGEKGTSGRGADDIGPWSYRQRTTRFPEPRIDGAMYSGATGMKDGAGANYYSFAWGDALVIVLDPFWSTTERIRGGGGDRGRDGPAEPMDASWAMTLGRAQYDWLEATLVRSTARHRFVFIHHLVGGLGGPEARGGAAASGYFEWGGKNADGSAGFSEHRPGWPMPIHDLLVKHRVSTVFHGHDHLHVHEQRDGVHYQCMAQPGNPAGNTRSAGSYGYGAAEVYGSPGHVRVRVEPEAATVEFVRSVVAGGRGREANGAVVDRYTIRAAGGR